MYSSVTVITKRYIYVCVCVYFNLFILKSVFGCTRSMQDLNSITRD